MHQIMDLSINHGYIKSWIHKSKRNRRLIFFLILVGEGERCFPKGGPKSTKIPGMQTLIMYEFRVIQEC